ncbi:hypothetical protein GCM10009744_19430 [Kribbella alba]|uniref:Uncharacterized protein n=1 Tax=Kribbella alba TaxID=190197 RepID=A0ABN2F5N9_9ACTN
MVLPGGFSYGDYLRAGAISRFAPVMGTIIEKAAQGLPSTPHSLIAGLAAGGRSRGGPLLLAPSQPAGRDLPRAHGRDPVLTAATCAVVMPADGRIGRRSLPGLGRARV